MWRQDTENLKQFTQMRSVISAREYMWKGGTRGEHLTTEEPRRKLGAHIAHRERINDSTTRQYSVLPKKRSTKPATQESTINQKSPETTISQIK